MEKIREIFWPLLEKGEQQTITALTKDDIVVEKVNIQKTLEYALKIYESELARNSVIETKASLFISSLAIITSVVLAITTTLIGQNGFNTVLFLLVSTLFILTIYVLRTVWFAVKVHERKPFHTFYHNDILIQGDEIEYSKTLISAIITKTKKNSLIINSKIDNMVMAQEYFKNAIVTLSIYAVLLIVFFIDKCKIGIKHGFIKTLKVLNQMEVETFLIIAIIIIAAVSLIINFILLRKLK